MTDMAIAKLEDRFTFLADHETQLHPPCDICWIEYHEEHQAARLACGHIFGHSCISSWAQMITISGRYNGWPYSFTEILPPTFYSRTQALKYWLILAPLELWDIIREGSIWVLWEHILVLHGGWWGLVFCIFLELWEAEVRLEQVSATMFWTRIFVRLVHEAFLAYHSYKNGGWRSTVFKLVISLSPDLFLELRLPERVSPPQSHLDVPADSFFSGKEIFAIYICARVVSTLESLTGTPEDIATFGGRWMV